MHATTDHLRRPIPASPGVLSLSLHRTGRHWAPALCSAVLLVDQATKAVQPNGAVIVNTGGAVFLPSAVGEALRNTPALGAVCDIFGTVILLATLNLIGRLGITTNGAAVTAVLAGLFSNLVDRLGTAWLFHAGLPRGVIDWIPVPLWPPARTNVADVVIALGILALGHQALRKATLAMLARRRNSPTGTIRRRRALERLDLQLVRRDDLTGAGAPAPLAVPAAS